MDLLAILFFLWSYLQFGGGNRTVCILFVCLYLYEFMYSLPRHINTSSVYTYGCTLQQQKMISVQWRG